VSAVRPRQLVHRGVISAAGFLIVGPQAERRALGAWVPGSRVYRLDAGLLLRLPAPLEVSCEAAPGLPLVPAGTVLLGLPLAADELESLAPPPESVVLARGGVAVVERLAEEARIEPSAWLDVSPFGLVEVRPLGARPAAAVLAAAAQAVDLRASLGSGRLDKPAELDLVLQALREGRPPAAERTPGWLRALGGWLAALAQAGPGQQVSGGSGRSAPAGRPRPPREGWLQRRLRGWATRLVLGSQLAPVVGRRQAQYLRRVMDLFQGGELSEALRHAVPLSSLPGQEPAPPALGVPSPRAEFRIHSGQLPTRSLLGLTGELFEQLKGLYRKAFERLDREGRIDEAAFVLLELLHANEEGVEFLERHGRLKLAAEVAEARELAPGLVIRLWLAAGDAARAIRIARRTGAFADAVVRLEKTDPKLAARLRRLWADTLAAGGDFGGAVEALWQVAEQRGRALEWMERAIEAGGPAAARMLARKLALVPEEFAALRGPALEVIEAQDEASLEARLTFSRTLLDQPGTSGIRTLARAAARSAIRDAGARGGAQLQGLIDRLVALSGDAALKAEAQRLAPAPALPPPSASVHTLDFSAADVGALPMCDAAQLASGRFLVALGEAGVRLLTPDGRSVAHFEQPAQRLVVSDPGRHAIALARRGEAWRLARLDLEARRSELWCLAALDGFAAEYDGLLWFVVQGDAVLAIDALAPGFEALWRMREPGARVRDLARSDKALACLIERPKPEVWSFELPSLTLRGRPELPVATAPELGVGPSGRVLLVRQTGPRAGQPAGSHALSVVNGAQVLPFLHVEEPGASVARPVLSAGWAALSFSRAGGCRVHVLDLAAPRLVARLALAGTGAASLRLAGARLAVADDRGRLLVYDAEAQRLAASLRL
jgi:hypothetical protein